MYKTKVLIVDDRPENILSLEHLILSSDSSLDILTATSGDQALELLLEHEFALSLLDVQMPGMSGIELATIMRSTERCKQIPIIFVTAARYEEKTIFEGYDKGAVDFLCKPLSAAIVRSKVRVFVELYRQRKELESQVQELQRLKVAAEAANCAKTQFLANMSHEMRTPLAAVLGFSELMNEPQLTPQDRQQCTASILRNGQVLMHLIDDILDLSKIESGRIQVERIRMPLAEWLDELRSTFAQRAAAKGLQLDFHLPEHLPHSIVSDPLRLRQILSNVLGNAIKFTKEGRVSLYLKVEPSVPRLLFTIEDTGRGLTQEERQKIFMPFVQADSSTTRLFGGTGLGLAIAQQLAQALGGDVKCLWSERGRGSVFTVSIDPGPLEETRVHSELPPLLAREKLPAWATEQQLHGLEILLVEDSADNRVLISRFLRLAGAEVTCAENGLEGVEKALHHDFALVLMDIQMPVVDGYEATRSLREKGYTRPIIALTAHALREERERSLRVGCNAHLTKPVDKVQLIETVARFSGRLVQGA